MTGYGQFCAVARALDVLGERWALLIVRELLLGASTFTEIRRGLPRIPRATLSARLRALRAAGVVDDSYGLTDAGVALAPVVRELARWAVATESAALTEDDLDTAALTWDIQRRINVEALPEQTVVVAIDFTDRDEKYWLHLSRTGVNLCGQDTGAAVDIWLAAPAMAVTRWWLGERSWAELLRHPDVHIDGDLPLQRQMHRWFTRYVFTPEALETSRSTGTAHG
ncbi:winged helix-turn-helix transcriptional regulator [Amycolatopsis echigonensis]|uniref:Helix-turn-helix transcriptional regulator n=1 Tax=Amycolatopsis echigonensis TaxID=2576905 RepID=A0A2N3X1N5_9PSEU|nr:MULTISPECIES: helix-turn-helix domain-containing protein [Amycolatopsis]MBB2500530.1 helix-turn-helix transcriptional regulator [Amycolatopsis echigonensis]PKW00037.1 HxlR family transcriptional regulator [Amycolatopsis niigatensis]